MKRLNFFFLASLFTIGLLTLSQATDVAAGAAPQIKGTVTNAVLPVPLGNMDVELFTGGNLVASTTTSSGGNYSFSGFQVEFYDVKVSHPGGCYVAQTQGGFFDGKSNLVLDFAMAYTACTE